MKRKKDTRGATLYTMRKTRNGYVAICSHIHPVCYRQRWSLIRYSIGIVCLEILYDTVIYYVMFIVTHATFTFTGQGLEVRQQF